jgi:hypothetical protein
MDGMIVVYRHLSTGGRGNNADSHKIQLPAPTSAIAEISIASMVSFGSGASAFVAFTACTTNGADGLPPVENFTVPGGLSPFQPRVLIRNGLIDVTYDIEIENCSVDIVFNVFFWPSVNRG